ncbi:MAG: MarR family winged helix-turn-helix transcriptional regulator [Lactobacillus sp.]|jgi:DNA-binding MarR family transcriptional regulator|nr:MarR family winged helix-turn-helix transcriptional regulator [Lactobacillus sp.]
MTIEDNILTAYHHLLMLDTDKDKEKQWISNQQPQAAGLSTLHFHILSYLAAHPNVLAKAISNDLKILRGTLSKQLAQLERRKMVTHYKDSSDARGNHYTLTPLGSAIAQTHNQLLAMKNQTLKAHLKEFTPENLQIIARFLQQITAAEENNTYPTNK